MHTAPRRLAAVARIAVVLSGAVLGVVGLAVIALQGRREDVVAAQTMRPLGYAVGVAFVVGSALAVVGVQGRRRWSRPVVVAGAVVLTFAVSVPSLTSAAYPLVLVIWTYVVLTRRPAGPG